VIEIVPGQHGFPTTRRVAGLASFLELSTVGVQMAVGTSAELHVAVPNGAARCIGLVALIAGHFDMQPG